jgi:hypothetical protein
VENEQRHQERTSTFDLMSYLFNDSKKDGGPQTNPFILARPNFYIPLFTVH